MKSHNENKEFKKDVIQWDVENWYKFISFIEKNGISFQGKNVLELGARDGGLSLYFALKGAKVVCSDLEGPTENAHILHKKYQIENNITYSSIDATNIPSEYNNSFDYIIFKSVIGGIGSFNDINAQMKLVNSIHDSLKNDGLVIFVDNMESSRLHKFFRRNFCNWGKRWHYETIEEIHKLFDSFELIKEKYVGFWGCFGRNEKMRMLLGKLDTIIFDNIFPAKWKYIGMYIYRK